MNSKRLYYVLLGLLVLMLGGILAGAYASDMLFQKQASVLLDQKAMSASLDDKQKQLIKDKKDIKTYAELNNIAKTIVPKDKDTAQAVREIVKLAQESNIPRLTSVTFPISTLGTATKPVATSSSGESGSSATTAAPKTTTNKNLTQLTPVKGIAGVYNLQITIQVNDEFAVPYATFTKFLEKLEQNRRTAQVSSITVAPTTKNPSLVTFTLVIDEYIKP